MNGFDVVYSPDCEEIPFGQNELTVKSKWKLLKNSNQLLVIHGNKIIVRNFSTKNRFQITHESEIRCMMVHKEEDLFFSDGKKIVHYNLPSQKTIRSMTLKLKEDEVVSILEHFDKFNDDVETILMVTEFTKYPQIKNLKLFNIGNSKFTNLSEFQCCRDDTKIDVTPIIVEGHTFFILSVHDESRPRTEIWNTNIGKKVVDFSHAYEHVLTYKTLHEGSDEKKFDDRIFCVKKMELGFHSRIDVFQPLVVSKKGDEKEKESFPSLKLDLVSRFVLDYEIEKDIFLGLWLDRYIVIPRGVGMVGIYDMEVKKTVYCFHTANLNQKGGNMYQGVLGQGKIGTSVVLSDGKLLVLEESDYTSFTFDVNMSGGGMLKPMGPTEKPYIAKIFDLPKMFDRNVMDKEELLKERKRFESIYNVFENTEKEDLYSQKNFDIIKIEFDNEREKKEFRFYKSLFVLHSNLDPNRNYKNFVAFTKNEKNEVTKVLFKDRRVVVKYLVPLKNRFVLRMMFGENLYVRERDIIPFFYLFFIMKMDYLMMVICNQIRLVFSKNNIITLFTNSCKLFENIIRKDKTEEKKEEKKKQSSFMKRREISFRSILSLRLFNRMEEVYRTQPQMIHKIVGILFGEDVMIRNMVVDHHRDYPREFDSFSFKERAEISFRSAFIDKLRWIKDRGEDDDEDKIVKNKRLYPYEMFGLRKCKIVYGAEDDQEEMDIDREILICRSNFLKCMLEKMKDEAIPGEEGSTEVIGYIIDYVYDPYKTIIDLYEIDIMIEILEIADKYQDYRLKRDLINRIQGQSKLLILTEPDRMMRRKYREKKAREKREKDGETENVEMKEKFLPLTFDNMLRQISSIMAKNENILNHLVLFWSKMTTLSKEEIISKIQEYKSLSRETIPLDYMELFGETWGENRDQMKGMKKKKKRKEERMEDEDEDEEEEGEEDENLLFAEDEKGENEKEEKMEDEEKKEFVFEPFVEKKGDEKVEFTMGTGQEFNFNDSESKDKLDFDWKY